MEITAWTLLVDAGLIGILLAIGAGLRAKIAPLRALMVPSSIIAGALGLLLGPAFLNILPFSSLLGSYPSVLVILVFACIAMTTEFSMGRFGRELGQFFGYTVLQYSIQIFVGLALVLVILKPLFHVEDSFGLVLFAGWAGGFGTAAAVGQVFSEAGQPEVADLAITSATVGLLIGVIGGIVMAKVGAGRGYAKHYAGLQSIPDEIKTGVLHPNGTKPAIGRHVFSGSSVESLAFQTGMVLGIAALAYLSQKWLKGVFPDVSVPAFSIAFIFGLVVNFAFSRLRSQHLIDRESISSISGSATDILILCGIASIKPSVVVSYWTPLLILFAVGLAVVLFISLVVAPRVLTDHWFEKQIFSFGWALGAVPQGIALLRIVDPKMQSKTLEQYALQGIANQNEILAVTFVPTLVVAGLAWTAVGIWGGASVLALALAIALSRPGKAQ